MKRLHAAVRIELMIFIGLVSFMPAPTIAQSTTDERVGSGLRALCNERNLAFQGSCDGYILGTVDMHKAMQENDKKCLFQIPNGTSREAITTVARRYLDGHEEQGSAPSWALIVLSMQEAYPCT